MKKDNEVYFEIKLRNNIECDKLTPQILSIIENQYAINFLNYLNISPNNYYIKEILSQHPLNECYIESSGVSGCLADIIKIYPYANKQKYSKLNRINKNIDKDLLIKNKLQKFENEILEIKDKNKINFNNIDKDSSEYIIPEINLKYIKEIFLNKVVFFNHNEQDVLLKYNYPFHLFKLTSSELKTVQHSFNISKDAIKTFIIDIINKFPFSELPLNIYSEEDIIKSEIYNSIKIEDNLYSWKKDLLNLQKNRYKDYSNKFNTNDVIYLRNLFISDEYTDLIGLILHVSYWVIFRTANPFLIEKELFKNIIIQLFSSYNNLKNKLENNNKLLLVSLNLPIFILITRIITYNLYIKNYYKFFFIYENRKEKLIQILNTFIIDNFDQQLCYNNLKFWNSKMIKSKKLNKKRIYYIDSTMKLLLKNTKNQRNIKFLKENNKYLENNTYNNLLALFYNDNDINKKYTKYLTKLKLKNIYN